MVKLKVSYKPNKLYNSDDPCQESTFSKNCVQSAWITCTSACINTKNIPNSKFLHGRELSEILCFFYSDPTDNDTEDIPVMTCTVIVMISSQVPVCWFHPTKAIASTICGCTCFKYIKTALQEKSHRCYFTLGGKAVAVH